MRTIRIASENTDSLYELNSQIEQTRATYEKSKQALDQQYLPTLKAMEQRRNYLISEVQKEEQIQIAQLQQQQQVPSNQTIAPASVATPAPAQQATV